MAWNENQILFFYSTKKVTISKKTSIYSDELKFLFIHLIYMKILCELHLENCKIGQNTDDSKFAVALTDQLRWSSLIKIKMFNYSQSSHNIFLKQSIHIISFSWY